jgi:pantetheine-phosphate adenylyltransferase
MRSAIYPGTFDPVTLGHLDILREARSLFDEVTVAVGINPGKVPLFSVDERVAMLRHAVSAEGWGNVEVGSFSGLTVDFARQRNAGYIVRGLRAVTDFEAEFALVLGNEQLDAAIKTVFVMPSQKHIYLSSSIVKQAIELGGRVIPGSVPPNVEAELNRKFAERA